MSETTNEQSKDIALYINSSVENTFLNVISSEKYSPAIREGFRNTMEILKQEKTLPDLYPTELAETNISTSQFQDTCVQMQQHFTPHRKVKQCLLELQGKIDALYAAKTGHKKAVLKCEKLKVQIEALRSEIADLQKNSMVPSTTIALKNIEILEKETKLEEAERGMKSSGHMIKDAALKVNQLQNLIERYRAEIEESGLSFEESEAIYYVMYFTSDAERQIRTSGRVDTGTFGAISQLPEALRKKVLQNISFIREKVLGGYAPDADYLHIVYRDLMMPKKTGENEFENVKIDDFIGMETIKILAVENKSE